MSSISFTDNTYNNNLFFYTTLKMMVKMKLSDDKLIRFQTLIKDKRNIFVDNVKGFKELILSSGLVKKGSKNHDELINLVETINKDNYEMWCDMVDCSIELVIFKDLIKEEAKAYSNSKHQNIEKTIADKLSLKYDTLTLPLPYGQRVVGSLLVYALTDEERDEEFFMPESNKPIKSIKDKINNLKDKYEVSCNSMFILIVNECINQSIKSTAGGSYEERVYHMITTKNISEIKPHQHDSKVSSVEYDYTFKYKNKTFGISAKRTLRERYKQNHDDVENLDVDYLILITLGIDLNEDKVDNILEKNGNYIIVANEIYSENEYMKKNKKVYSSSIHIEKVLDRIMGLKEDETN